MVGCRVSTNTASRFPVPSAAASRCLGLKGWLPLGPKNQQAPTITTYEQPQLRMYPPAYGVRASALSDGSAILATNSLPRDDTAEFGGGPSTARYAGELSRVRDVLPSVSVQPARLFPPDMSASSVRSRGALKIASLNMNGAYSRVHNSSGSGSQDKWMLLNQLMRQERIAILALQETHYMVEQAERLNRLFDGLMRVYVSPDPTSPSAARGVAFAVNLRIMRDDSVVTQVCVPGRAMTLSLRRRRGSRLAVLNAYAPNVMSESVAFWNQLCT